MLRGNIAFEEMMDQSSTIVVDMLRYCMTDLVSVPVTTVLTDNHTPFSYAHQIIRTNYAGIHRHFFTPRLNNLNVSKSLTQNWAFDLLVLAASLLRVIDLRSGSLSYVETLTVSTPVYTLTTPSTRNNNTLYGGLANFKPFMDVFIASRKEILNNQTSTLLKTLVECVSDITSPKWILHDPRWKKICLHRIEKIRALRNFLHVALISYMVSDDTVFTMFDLSRTTITDLMEEFVYLRTSTEIDNKAITNFLSSLSFKIDDIAPNILARAMFEGSSDTFHQIHHNLYGDRFSKPKIAATTTQITHRISL